MDHIEHDNELKHYGVPGMKWGVRRARRAAGKGNSDKATKVYSKTYSKATKKANKLNQKAVNKNLKAAKLQKKALEKEVKATNEKQYQKARKIQFKANEINLQAAKLEKKGAKWEKKMESAFTNVSIKDVDPATIEAGKKYAYMLMK